MAYPENKSNTGLIIGIIFGVLGFIVILMGGCAVIVFSGSSFGYGNIAEIPVEGIILSGEDSSLFGGIAASDDIIAKIKMAEEDDSIEAILIEINSPGGAPVPSEEIAEVIRGSEKLTVAYVRDVGASGGYWIASSADVVFCSRLSAVGSIGVIGSYLDYSGFIDNHNITYNRLVSGPYKDAGSPWKELTVNEEAIIQEEIDYLHKIFVNAVADNRDMDVDEVAEIATGRIYYGENAVELGLVDYIGGRDDAIAFIEIALGIEADVVSYEKESTFFELIESRAGFQSYNIGLGIGTALVNKQPREQVMLI